MTKKSKTKKIKIEDEEAQEKAQERLKRGFRTSRETLVSQR